MGYNVALSTAALGAGRNEARITAEISHNYTSPWYHLRLAEMLTEQGKSSEAQLHLQLGKQMAREGNYRRLLEKAEKVSA